MSCCDGALFSFCSRLYLLFYPLGGLLLTLAWNGLDKTNASQVTYATVQPFHGYYTHYGLEGTAQLLPCESNFSCIEDTLLDEVGQTTTMRPVNDTARFDDRRAVCGLHFMGFMCAECEEGYAKVSCSATFSAFCCVSSSCVVRLSLPAVR